jgi:hypothetical protein
VISTCASAVSSLISAGMAGSGWPSCILRWSVRGSDPIGSGAWRWAFAWLMNKCWRCTARRSWGWVGCKLWWPGVAPSDRLSSSSPFLPPSWQPGGLAGLGPGSVSHRVAFPAAARPRRQLEQLEQGGAGRASTLLAVASLSGKLRGRSKPTFDLLPPSLELSFLCAATRPHSCLGAPSH